MNSAPVRITNPNDTQTAQVLASDPAPGEEGLVVRQVGFAALVAAINALVLAIDIYIANETPGGPINGINVAFTTFYVYKPGTTKLYVNGVRQREGLGYDYIEIVTHDGFTMAIPPLLGDILLVDYVKA